MATVAMTDPKTDHKMAGQKQKSLITALSQIERSYGEGAIMRMGTDGAKVMMEAISTGAMNLDAAIGIGGLPRGRISEIYGPESSGKTTLCLHVIANAQRTGGIAAFIDVDTLWTWGTPVSSVWTSTTCWCHSPILENRRLRSRRCSFGATRWMLWRSTP